MKKKQIKKAKNLGGRPSVMTDDVIQKLKEAFLIGATNDEACLFSGIAPATLYTHINANKEFSENISKWKQDPVLKAKRTIVENLDDPKISQWYLEKKKRDEFGEIKKIELETIDNKFAEMSVEEKAKKLLENE